MECIICFEPVATTDLYTPECGCKYTSHVQCIREWNGTCVICNEPQKPRLRREMICVAVCAIVLLGILARTIL